MMMELDPAPSSETFILLQLFVKFSELICFRNSRQSLSCAIGFVAVDRAL